MMSVLSPSSVIESSTTLARRAMKTEIQKNCSETKRNLPSSDCFNSARKQQSEGRPLGSKPMAHFFPIHVRAEPSLLSHDNKNPASYTGFQNLAMIALTITNARMIIEDYRKYGLIMTFYKIGLSQHDLKLVSKLLLTTPLHLLVAFGIEYFASLYVKKSNIPHKPKQLWQLFAVLHAINAALSLAITSFVVFYYVNHPFIGTICECHALVLCLKLSSYALTNRDLRDSYLKKEPIPPLYASCPYPRNISISNLLYFWLAPTLVYQPVYPRSENIRWTFLFKRALEIVGTIFVIWFLSGKYAIPILEHSLSYFEDGDMLLVLESLMKLSSVSMGIWLIGFFLVFQSFLNFLAELLRFGDRNFYQDWWNSGSVGTYWRLWNKPVTNYFKRHFYVPLRKRGYGQVSSSMIVFSISAFLHEILVGVPTKNFIGVAFFCIIVQVPLIMVTAPLERMRGPGTRIGNCIFWVSFFLGQPTGVLLYYFAWNIKRKNYI